MVVVQGDTTTAYACALAAFYRKIKVTHVEAGLRTFDKRNPFPEEANRRMISVLADLHCAPTVGSRENLRAEGIPAKDICTVGNTVIDALQWMRREMSEKARRAAEIRFHAAGKRVVLVTAHRRENWGAPLAELCKGIAALAKTHDDVVFVWPLHPHPQVRSVVNPLLQGIVNVVLCEPLRYDECVFLLDRAHTVVTDSGGVQEEAAAIGKPICVFRKTTERPEVIACGAGELLPCTAKGVISRVGRLLDDALWHKKRCKATKAFGDGRASQKIADRMFRCLGEVA
jgi:UDP-N-acetylglucosamine 2-epimerase (non-hydrolysing)